MMDTCGGKQFGGSGVADHAVHFGKACLDLLGSDPFLELKDSKVLNLRHDQVLYG